RSELVAAHDLGADVPREIAGEVVVEPARASGVGAVHPARGGAGPGKEIRGAGGPERLLQALAFTRAEPVPRHVEALHAQQLRHFSSILREGLRTWATMIPVLWLSGPPGVGKTAVAWEIYRRLARAGADPAYVDVDQL